VLRLNLRDHGDTQALNIGLFHSCRLGEVVGAVRSLQHQHPRRELSLVGFSLGGNFGLRADVGLASPSNHRPAPRVAANIVLSLGSHKRKPS